MTRINTFDVGCCWRRWILVRGGASPRCVEETEAECFRGKERARYLRFPTLDAYPKGSPEEEGQPSSERPWGLDRR